MQQAVLPHLQRKIMVLSEIVSLVTAKLVGMGIIGHQFSLSWSAIEWTLAGFLAIKLTALLILSGRISRQESGTVLSQPTNRPKKQMPSVIYGLAAICGSVMLAVVLVRIIPSTLRFLINLSSGLVSFPFVVTTIMS